MSGSDGTRGYIARLGYCDEHRNKREIRRQVDTLTEGKELLKRWSARLRLKVRPSSTAKSFSSARRTRLGLRPGPLRHGLELRRRGQLASAGRDLRSCDPHLQGDDS
jgi:hypothetical protein